jgi:predicted 3-demethylubiquinone-9 3-methyltransferase (glyoxalase superfamily)
LDSPDVHAFGFTPAISMFVYCDSADEVDRLYEALSTDGQALMPVGSYPFAERFAWVSDRFGVSWQLTFTRPVVGRDES